jgi:hypothetical protein
MSLTSVVARIDGPNVPALLFKQMFYGHARLLDFLSELLVRVFKTAYFPSDGLL